MTTERAGPIPVHAPASSRHRSARVATLTLTFDRFFERAWPSAYRLAGLLTQNAGAGEEVAQEAMTRLYANWGTVEHPDAYLRRTIVNLSVNRGRRERTRRTKLPLLAVPETVDLVVDELADLIARLPERQRAVIVLRYYYDLSEAEIADTLGCRPGTVKSLASRALAQLATVVDR